MFFFYGNLKFIHEDQSSKKAARTLVQKLSKQKGSDIEPEALS